MRDARARIIADDLVTARTALDQELADESLLVARQQEVEAQSEAARDQEARLEAALRDDLPALAKAQETWFALAGLKERVRGTQSLATERVRNAQATVETVVDAGPRPRAARGRGRRAARRRRSGSSTRSAATAPPSTRRSPPGTRPRTPPPRRSAGSPGLERAAADRREGLARLHGQVNAARSRAAAASDEIGRLEQAREEALARAARAQHDFTSLETRVAGLDAGEEGLDAEHEAAAAGLSDLEDRLAKAREEAQRADRDRSTLTARKDALELGLSRKDGAGALLAASGDVSGLLGSVAALLTVRGGYEAAVASALGAAADAVVVDGAAAAVGRHRPPQGRRPRPGRPGRRRRARHRCGTRRLAGDCPARRRTPSTRSSAPTPCAPR